MSSNKQERYLVLQQKILKFAGICLQKKESIWYKIYSRIVIGTVVGCPLIVIYAILTTENNLEIVLGSFAFIVSFTTSSIKIVGFFCARKRLIEPLERLQSGVFAPNINRGGKLEQELMDECTFYNKSQLVFLIFLSISSIGSSVVETLIRRYTEEGYCDLPYGVYSLYPIQSSPNFEIALLHQVIMTTIMTSGICSVTTFIAGVMVHISYQCKCLQNLIRTSVVYTAKKYNLDKNSNPSDIPWEYLKVTLKEIVDYHNAITELAAQFESVLNVLALIDFLGISVGICSALFTVSIYPSLNVRLVKHVILAGGNVFLQFITAYWGHQVLLESAGVAEAATDANYLGDVKFQKCLITIMQRSQRRLVFTVGGFAPLTLDTFSKVIRSSYSYFMLLNHFSENLNIDR